jgi:hypothetical protein
MKEWEQFDMGRRFQELEESLSATLYDELDKYESLQSKYLDIGTSSHDPHRLNKGLKKLEDRWHAWLVEAWGKDGIGGRMPKIRMRGGKEVDLSTTKQESHTPVQKHPRKRLISSVATGTPSTTIKAPATTPPSRSVAKQRKIQPQTTPMKSSVRIMSMEDSPSPTAREGTPLSPCLQTELLKRDVSRLEGEVNRLEAENSRLQAEVKELRAKLDVQMERSLQAAKLEGQVELLLRQNEQLENTVKLMSETVRDAYKRS